MEAFRARQFAKAGAAPNTFIGGIAKTGGTGVNAPIDTPYKLSQKLGISVNRITGFRVIGDDVECRIRGTYTGTGFGGAISADGNKNIKSFIDNDGLVTSITDFFLPYTTVINVKLPSITVIPATGFRGAFSLKNLDAPLVVTVGSTAFQNDAEFETFNAKPVVIGNIAFEGCTKLTLDTSDTTTLTGTQGRHFRNMRQAEFNLNNLTSTQGMTFTFRDNPMLKKVYANNLVNLMSSDSQPCNEAFTGCTTFELFEAKKLKTIGSPSVMKNFFTGSSSGATIRVHEFMATSNSGTADLDLVHAKNNYGATVEFYDDAGDYVSTL